MRIRALYHIAFWGSFCLLFLQQNPDADGQDYLAWLKIFCVSAFVVYVNLYVLFPRYFFPKRYLVFAILLLLLLCLGAGCMQLLLATSNDFYALPFFQNFINLFLFVVITSSLKFFREFLKKQKQLVKIENEQLKSEVSVLKSQVNPHFLFNTLNNLYGLIVQNQNKQAANITLKLSDLMRYMLDSSRADKVSLQKEVKFIEDYLALEKIRLSQLTDIRFDVSGLDKDVSLAPMLFIPLVENVFKHGLNCVSDSSYAYFSLALQGDELYFEARNSIGKKREKPNSGTGLENLRKRLSLIYAERHFLEVEEKEDDFKVVLCINI